MTGAPASKTVLVYRRRLLPYSNTFIADQMRAYQTWRGILFGRRMLRELPLDGVDVRLLKRDRSSFPGRVHERLLESLGRVHSIANLARERPRLVHAHFGTDGVDAEAYARAMSIPLVVTLHGYDINVCREWWEAGHGGSRMRSYPERLLKLARQPFVHFIAVSNAIRERAIEYGIPEEKLTVRYVGVDTKRFAPAGRPVAERDPRVLFIGQLVENKGCEYLIRAVAEVQRTVPGVTLAILGDGELRDGLQRLADSLGVRAEFRGAVTSVDVAKELERARVCCLPSVTITNGASEAFGLVLLEAQSSGVPVVSSARGGSVEGLVDGVTGFRVRERDETALADRLLMLLADAPLAASMSEAARRFACASFEIGRKTAELETLYDRITCRGDSCSSGKL
jgi:glycosyltransferase involved in cell wall biosynthesis